MEREQLINRIKSLTAIITEKQRKYQEENNLGPEVGCITKESFLLLRLWPEMQRLGITFDDCR